MAGKHRSLPNYHVFVLVQAGSTSTIDNNEVDTEILLNVIPDLYRRCTGMTSFPILHNRGYLFGLACQRFFIDPIML